jgi:hypothetical protein
MSRFESVEMGGRLRAEILPESLGNGSRYARRRERGGCGLCIEPAKSRGDRDPVEAAKMFFRLHFEFYFV